MTRPMIIHCDDAYVTVRSPGLGRDGNPNTHTFVYRIETVAEWHRVYQGKENPRGGRFLQPLQPYALYWLGEAEVVATAHEYDPHWAEANV